MFSFSTCLYLVYFLSDYDHAGGQRTQTKSGPVILADEAKNPAMEKLELVRKWSLNTYKVCNFILMFPPNLLKDYSYVIHIISLQLYEYIGENVI